MADSWEKLGKWFNIDSGNIKFTRSFEGREKDGSKRMKRMILFKFSKHFKAIRNVSINWKSLDYDFVIL